MAALNISVEQNLWKTPSRRSSMESILSIQGKETDYVQDTSDTASCATDSDDASANEAEEYEPVTDHSEDAPISNESDGSEDQIISTKVVEVSVRDDGELSFADAEADDSDDFDKELGFHDYWKCAQCNADNNTPWYRYCQKCFQVRKNFFPPRPKRKSKRRAEVAATPVVTKTESHDSDVDSGISQGFSQSQDLLHPIEEPSCSQSPTITLKRQYRKRHSSLSSMCSESDHEIRKKSKMITPIIKTVSDPQLTVECDKIKLTKKAIANSLKDKLDADSLCMICFSEPKTGVFVHGRIAHICCCYKCSLKVWSKAKRCPLCNCKVSNVLRAVM